MNLLQATDTANVVISAFADGVAKEKAKELGLEAGMKIDVVKGSPAGKIIIIQIGERFFALTTDMAKNITVKE